MNPMFLYTRNKTMTNKERLLDKVVAQILEDIGNEDLTAIYELIEPLPTECLEGFLSEK